MSPFSPERLRLLACSLFFLAFTANASQYKNFEVERIIQSGEEPDGVVFELMSWKQNTWQWASPMISQFSKDLREKYPELDIAVVSHGNEQFDLVKRPENDNLPGIAQLKSISEDNVDVHVCGTFSGWRDVPAEAYLDFIDVAPSGPAQVNNYIKLGYKHVTLREPDNSQ